MELFEKNNLQVIWQTGKNYFSEFKKHQSNRVKVFEFIDDVGSAYSAADLVVARAGATTIAEISCLGIPAIFVPSPNVAANHQFKNAEALYKQGACELIKDDEAREKLAAKALELLESPDKLNLLGAKIKENCKPNAAKIIAERCVKLAEGV